MIHVRKTIHYSKAMALRPLTVLRGPTMVLDITVGKVAALKICNGTAQDLTDEQW